MRAVVTGGAGFIGSTLVDRLLEKGDNVVVVDNLGGPYSENFGFLQPHIGKEGFRLDRINILDLNGLRQSVAGADIIFHLAAQADTGSGTDLVKAQMANATGTLNVLLAAKHAGVRRVISSSSSSVYGNASSLPARETDPTVPASPRGSSKLATEEYCHLFHNLYGLESLSLRYFTVYGPRQRPDTVISALTERALKGQRPQIRGDGNLAGDYVFISDAVDAILRCIHCPDPNGAPLNICSGVAITTDRLVCGILEATGRPDLEPEYLPPGPDEEERIWGDNTRAKYLLGWEPRVQIEEGLVEFVEWYKKSRT
jgi:UDP-glucose 4-epimerase